MAFRYLRDPLFLLAVAAYVANRLVLKRLLGWPFLHEHLNDLACIPFWVPILVLVLRRAGFRPHDAPPQLHEVVLPLILWSAWFEVVLPAIPACRRWCVADPWDVFYYSLGALLAGCAWRVLYGPEAWSMQSGVEPRRRVGEP